MSESRTLFYSKDVTDVAQGYLYGPREARVLSVSIDSREVSEGTLFVPLPGERTDGHRFIADALRAGAAATCVSSTYFSRHKDEILAAAQEKDAAVCVVQSPLETLQKLAAKHVRTHGRAQRIGVTGSNGKTTTKELIAHILSGKGTTFYTRGNFNSEIGVPLSVFDLTEQHQYAVFEMGMNHPGEMAILADIVRPDLAVITNIGTAHVGLLGSREAIAREKKEIFSRFSGREIAFIPLQDPYVDLLKEGVDGKVVLYDAEHTEGWGGYEDLGLHGSVLLLGELRVTLALPGRHNVKNAVAAIAVARALGATDAETKAGIEQTRAVFGRSEILEGPVTVIQDCYNANEESTAGAIDFAMRAPWEGRRIMVLGAMKELGGVSSEAHMRVAEAALRVGPDALFLVGEEFRAAYEKWHLTEIGPTLLFAPDSEEITDKLSHFVRPGDLVLLKGSRSVGLERTVPALQRIGA